MLTNMKVDSNSFRAWFITSLLLSNLVSVVFPQTEVTDGGQCQDGNYTHDGRKCCQCGAGQFLVKHCTENLQRGKCEPCPPDTYSDHPNHQTRCELCTSCSQTSANLEEAEPCTPARNRVCRCKKDHYCDADACTLCQPCKKCGAEGIKAACTAKNNTVCNDEIEEGNNAGIIAGVIVLVALILAGVAVYFWKRRQARNRSPTANGQLTTGDDVERQPLRVPDVDIQPHLPDIAIQTGWTAMRDVAIRSSIPDSVIESCKLDHPNDSQEWTLQLLRIWVERQGRQAPNNLVQILQDAGRRATAEKVVDVLSRSS